MIGLAGLPVPEQLEVHGEALKLLRWARKRMALVSKNCFLRTAGHRSLLLLIYVALFFLCMTMEHVTGIPVHIGDPVDAC
mgnify:CR=1 FL=1